MMSGPDHSSRIQLRSCQVTVELASADYTVHIWHPRMRERPAIERKLTVSDSGAQLQVSLTAALRPQHLDGQRAMDAY